MDLKKIPADIMSVVDGITAKFDVKKIYLYSNKRKGVGKSAGFKLCIILDCDDIEEAERKIYLDIDSEVPFDVMLYYPKTWMGLLERKGSFAQRIAETGVLVYG